MNTPDLYIEITSNKFKTSSNSVYQQSYLHESWDTQRVYRLHPFQSGVYLLYDLHKNPHYQLPITFRKEFDLHARRKNIPVIDICTGTYTEQNEIYHFSSESKIYQRNIFPYFSNLEVNDIISLLDKQHINKRGNYAHNIGWHTLNFKFQGQINIPSHSEVNEMDQKYFRLLTKCLKSLLYDIQIEPQPFHTNIQRTKEFANQLTELNNDSKVHSQTENIDNVFESMTYALTYLGKNENLLQPHIDSLNCTQIGFNCVFGIYFNMNHPIKKSCPIRLIILGYSRKSINDFYVRLNKRMMFKNHLLTYYSFLDVRQTLTLTNAIPLKYYQISSEQIIFTLPFVDKCSFYSIFVSCLFDLTKVHKDITIDQIIELVLPIGWLTTGSNYYKIIKMWEKIGLPKGKNLTVSMIKSLIDIGGSISSGKGPRLQPYANKFLSNSDIQSGLRSLKNMIVMANSSNKKCSISVLNNILIQNIKFVGYIGSQHLISILTLLRVIHNPVYVRETTILQNTTTEKKIKKYYGLSYKLINVLYKEISELKFNGCIRLVENLVCEFFRDIKEPLKSWNASTYKQSIEQRMKGITRHPDTFYTHQSLFIENNYIISRYYYSKKSSYNTRT